MDKNICFIGHRYVVPRQIRKKLTDIVLYEIQSGCNHFMMGTRGDFDELALSVCRQLRKSFNEILIEVVITSLSQIKTIIEKDEYGEDIYKPYEDVKTIMYDIENVYFKEQITVSNRKMIDDCDTVICYVDESRTRSGAKKALSYAKRKGKKIINLYEDEN